MSELLRMFYEVWRQAGTTGKGDTGVPLSPVYCRGRFGPIMIQMGMGVEQAELGARLEFLSPKRAAWSGFWIEELPRDFSADAIQRLFATAFLGLHSGAPLMVLFEHHEPVALLTWLRQAGFHALTQGQAQLQGDNPSAPVLKTILARRI